MLFAGIRFTLAGIITVIIYSIARRKILLPKKENIGRVLTVSCFQTVIQYIFFYVGLANTSGVKGTVASGSSAFFALLIAAILFRQEKLTLKKIVACILGFAGIVLINLNGLDFTMNFTGDCFVIFSTISSAFSSVLIKKIFEIRGSRNDKRISVYRGRTCYDSCRTCTRRKYKRDKRKSTFRARIPRFSLGDSIFAVGNTAET